MKGANQPGPDPKPLFVSTGEAAKLLGVDRGYLDVIASVVAGRRPDLVCRVGSGTRRRYFRWLRTALAEAVNVGSADLVQPVEVTPASPRKVTRRRARVSLREVARKAS